MRPRVRSKAIPVDETADAGPEAIDQRLKQLDREWDVERCLETGASTLMLASALLLVASNRMERYTGWPLARVASDLALMTPLALILR